MKNILTFCEKVIYNNVVKQKLNISSSEKENNFGYGSRHNQNILGIFISGGERDTSVSSPYLWGSDAFSTLSNYTIDSY